jgi:hypothetical protein
LTHKYVPHANKDFQIVALNGGKYAGRFRSVAGKFSADYAHEASSPAYVGAIYDKSRR